MEKIIALGDTHGRDTWKAIVAKEEDADKIVFIGDYFDSFGIKPHKQIENFKEILEFKRKNLDKVVLLIGNHDFHYMKWAGETYSGYNEMFASEIGEVIHQALDEELMQACFVSDKYLFTHAGVTKTWCATHGIDPNNIEEEICLMFENAPGAFRFKPSTGLDNTGDSITQPPFWVRPRALTSDMVEGYTQVVGHTTRDNIYIDDTLMLIDCPGDYVEITKDGVWQRTI